MCAPGLFVVPYLYTVSRGGHPAMDPTRSPLANALDSLVSGGGLAQIATATTLPWLIFFVIGTAILRGRSPLRVLYLAILPAYVLYHAITPALWPLGRYQVEYIAPLIALTIFLLALQLPRRHHAMF
jgi:hypothetical protein